jgi:hypothetical protein
MKEAEMLAPQVERDQYAMLADSLADCVGLRGHSFTINGREVGHSFTKGECQKIVTALRAAARPAPAAGVIDREAVAELIYKSVEPLLNECSEPAREDYLPAADAILALKPTMAGEPVAWRKMSESGKGRIYLAHHIPEQDMTGWTPLYSSPAPSGRDPATIEACAKVAEDLTPAKHQGTLAAHVTGIMIAKAIRALAAPAVVTEERA